MLKILALRETKKIAFATQIGLANRLVSNYRKIANAKVNKIYKFFVYCVTATCIFHSYKIALFTYLQVLFLVLQIFLKSGSEREKARVFPTP